MATLFSVAHKLTFIDVKVECVICSLYLWDFTGSDLGSHESKTADGQ